MVLVNSNSSESNLKKIHLAKDNLGLTKSKFDAHLMKIGHRDESSLIKIFCTHLQDSVTYLGVKFKNKKENAYNTYMDTMLEFRRKLLEGKIQCDNLRYLFTIMTLNNYLNDLRQVKKTLAIIDDAIDHVTENQDADNQRLVSELFYFRKQLGTNGKRQKAIHLLNDVVVENFYRKRNAIWARVLAFGMTDNSLLMKKDLSTLNSF